MSADFSAILDAREARWLRRQELCRQGTLLTLTMNVPGPDKNLPDWNGAHRKVSAMLQEDLREHLLFFEERGTPAGIESHFATDLPPSDLKKYVVVLEEKHPVGRLLDADVMNIRGEVVGREDLGLPLRRCFCCDRPAMLCAREERHSLEELLSCAEKFLNAWRDEC